MEPDVIICRCEEVTRAEIEEAIARGATTVDDVKRYTRAGMGFCQGGTCWRLVAAIIASKAHVPQADVRPPHRRPPVRALTVGDMGRRSLGDVPS